MLRDPTPGSFGRPARALGRSGLGKEGCSPGEGGIDDPAPGFASSVTRPLRGPGPRLQRRASWHIPAHPASLGQERAPGEGSAQEAEGGGRSRRGVSGNRAPGPSPPFRPAPRELDQATPFSPPCCAPPSVPHCSQPISLPGRGEGVPRSSLKGPSPLLVSWQVASTSGVGRAPAPLVPQPSSGAAAPAGGQGVRAAPLPRAFFSHPGLPGRRGSGTRGTGTPPSAGAVGGGGPETRQAAPLEPGAGSGTQWGAQRAGWGCRERRAGAGPPGDRPCAARKNGRPAGRSPDLE